MYKRLLQVAVVLALLVVLCLGTIQVSKASGGCGILGASCVDDGCRSSGGHCGSYPNCSCAFPAPPPPSARR